jgi:hypothetical protein
MSTNSFNDGQEKQPIKGSVREKRKERGKKMKKVV